MIEKECYKNWKSLTSIQIHSNIERIEEGAFENCVNLEAVEFLDINNVLHKLQSIGSNAFKNCVKLTSISLPMTLQSIHPRTFDGCNKEMEKNCSEKSKRQMESNLLISKEKLNVNKRDYEDYCNVETMKISRHVNVYPKETFFSMFTNLKHLECNPECISLFNNKQQIETFTIPNKIESINKKDFEGFTNLTFLKIPISVKEIEESSFDNLKNIQQIECKFEHLKLFKNKEIIKTIIILDGWFDKEKYLNIFENCINLENVLLPDDCSSHIKEMFKNCSKLKYVCYTSGKKEELLVKL